MPRGVAAVLMTWTDAKGSAGLRDIFRSNRSAIRTAPSKNLDEPS